MTPKELIDAFEILAGAPDGITRLRQLVLTMAVRGTLVSQNPADGFAEELLSTFGESKKKLIEDGAITVPRHPEGEPVSEPPYEVPSGWVWVRLGDVGAIVGGGTPKSKDPACWADEGVPWLTPADMRRQESRYVSRGDRDISEVGLASSSARLMPAGTILFSSRAPIGHVGIAAQELSTNQGFKSCVPYCSDMSEYIYLFLKKVGSEIDAAATGTTFKEVSGKEVSLIPIPVPPLPEQHRITEQVDELMALLDRLEAAQGSREATRQALRDAALSSLGDANDAGDVQVAWDRAAGNLDQLVAEPADTEPVRRAILQLAIHGRLVAQDASDESAELLLERIAAEKTRLIREKQVRRRKAPEPLDSSDLPFELPENWRWCRLEDLLYTLGDGPHYSPKYVGAEEGVPFLSTRNITASGFRLGDIKHVSRHDHIDFCKRVRAEKGDVLYTKGGTTGIALVNDLHFEFSVWVHVAILKIAREYLAPRYVALALNAPHCYEQSQAYTHGTGNRDLGLTRMVKITMPLPPLPEQHRIVAKVDELMAYCDELEARLQAAQDAREYFASTAVAAFA